MLQAYISYILFVYLKEPTLSIIRTLNKNPDICKYEFESVKYIFK